MDIRIERMAQVLVEYSLQIQPKEWVTLAGDPVATPLMQALNKTLLEAGAYPQIIMTPNWADYQLLRYANDDQLRFISPIIQLAVDQADVRVTILSPTNTKALSNIDPARVKQRNQAMAPVMQSFIQRISSKAMRWVGTLFPTSAYAQDAEMSLEEYEDFVYGACLLDDPDPIARWREVSTRQQALVDWLQGHQQVHIRGENVDLHLSIAGRAFQNADGRENFPDGEIFTSPIEDSANGWVRFTYPAPIGGREVSGIELTFEEGRVVKASAKKNEELLLALLETDPGACFLGELGIGTNPGITRFTKNTLFDEKIQGTFHLAVGMGFPRVGGKNQSAIHQDIVCDLHDGEIVVDGEVFYRNGDFVIVPPAASPPTAP